MGRVRDIKNFRTTSYRKSQPANATQRSQENYRKETMEAVQRIGDRLRGLDNNDSFDWDFESSVVSTRRLPSKPLVVIIPVPSGRYPKPSVVRSIPIRRLLRNSLISG